MTLQPAEPAQSVEVASSLRGGLSAASHEASLLHGATVTGEAARRDLTVRIGLWLEETGKIRHARCHPVEDPTLRSYAEAACSLLETGADPRRLDAASLRGTVPIGAADCDRAELVAAAIQAACAMGGWRDLA